MALACLAAFLLPGLALAASTFVTSRAVTDKGTGPRFLVVDMDIATGRSTTTAMEGYWLVDRILPGSRDRVTVQGSGIENFIGPTFYSGERPAFPAGSLLLESSSLLDWVDVLRDGSADGNGDLDGSLGVVFGELRDELGGTVAGATVSVSPTGGTLFYCDDAGTPDPALQATTSSGRFLVLDVPPGELTVEAWAASERIGRAYGRVLAGWTSGLGPAPLFHVTGGARDESGAAVGGAAIEWDLDASVAGSTDGAGAFSLQGLVRGLDVTLRGSASGYRPALTFRHERDRLPVAAGAGFGEATPGRSLDVGFLSEGAYTSWPAAFGTVQAPSLGLVFGRVVSAAGEPLSGATVQVDPAVGEVRYFDGLGQPDPLRVKTSESGLFIVLNVPVGNVVLSAVAPNATVRTAVAPSAAGAVTCGELRGTARVAIEGRIQDELFRSYTVGGAVVTLVEYPQFATIADSGGTYSLSDSEGNGLPAGEWLTFKIERSGYKTSYAFLETLESDSLCTRLDCTCPGESDTDYDPDCSQGKPLFLISETGYFNLYLQLGAFANRNLGLVSAGVFLDNGMGAVGFLVDFSPASGTLRYSEGGSGSGAKALTTIGGFQLLNASPGSVLAVVVDPRTGFTRTALIRVGANTVALSEGLTLRCPGTVPGEVANLYPCDGATIRSSAKDMYFQWESGTIVKGRLQISPDPLFEGCAAGGASNLTCFQTKSRSQDYWYANKDSWKRIKKLGESGSPLYWRVVLKGSEGDVPTEPFVFYLP